LEISRFHENRENIIMVGIKANGKSVNDRNIREDVS